MSKKIVYIIHGWYDNPKNAWFPWLKSELKKRGFEVVVPEMPNPKAPKIKTWVSKLNTAVKDPNADTYFVGHSIGAQAIMRYLEKLPKGKKVAGVAFVAGWFKLTNLFKEEKQIAKPWLQTKINFDKVKRVSKKFITIFSDDDIYVPLKENKKIFYQKLGAKILIEHKKGHFSGEDGVKKLPIVLSEFLKLSK